MATNRFANRTVLVTGANSGLGYEAAAQLAEAGFGRIILACRTLEKAEGARRTLTARAGRDPFDTLAVDVSNLASAERAAKTLIERGHALDALLLNAGMVPGDEALQKTADGLEIAFASSVIGHHVLTSRLLESGLLADGARAVIAGSEAANGDLPAMMETTLYDFANDTPKVFGDNLREAMLAFARGERPDVYRGMPYYTTTKAFSAWWAAAMDRANDGVAVFNVSPGANMGTSAARNVTGFKKFLFTKVMPALGPVLGMSMPTELGAKRYVDVLLDDEGKFESGRTYTSAPKKMVGPLFARSEAHLVDEERQETALSVLNELAGLSAQGTEAPQLRAVG